MWISRDSVRRDLEMKNSGVQPAQGFPAACAKGPSWRFAGAGTLAEGHLLHAQVPTVRVRAALSHLLLVS